MALPSPERAKGWLAMAWPLLVQGGPVVSLLLLLIGTSLIWLLLGALERSVVRNQVLTERLLTLQDTHRAELLRYVHCQREP